MRNLNAVIKASIVSPIRFFAAGTFHIIRYIPQNGVVEWLVRILSFVIRCVPENRLIKPIFTEYSLLLKEHRFSFIFRCRDVGVSWTASAFPDLLTRHMMFEGMYQQDVLVALRSLIKSGDVVFDVGGHHGLMAIVSSMAVGETGKVITFEPSPHARRHLETHIAINKVQNVIVEIVALSDKNDRTVFYIQIGDITWNSTIIKEFGDADDFKESIMVRTVTLDHYIAQSKIVPNVVKLDVEGAEFLILNGAKEMLRKHKPTLIVEFNPLSAQAGGHSISQYVELLEQESYRLVVLKSDLLGRFRATSWEAFDETKHIKKYEFVNVICIPQHGDSAAGTRPISLALGS